MLFKEPTLKPIMVTNDNIGTIMSMRRDQPFHAWKVVKEGGKPAMRWGTSIRYAVGSTYEEQDADCSPHHECSNGLHLATRDWCASVWPTRWEREHTHLMLCEFHGRDLAAIPSGPGIGTGKFRVFKFKILREFTSWRKNRLPVR